MRSIVVAFIAMSMLAALPAGAAVVTVTPVTNTPTGVTGVVENELTNSWSIVTNRFGVGELSPTGPCLPETPFGFNSNWDGDGIDFGRGAFYASCDYVGQGSAEGDEKTPSTIFLGMDEFNGQPVAGVKLNQIKSLNYWAYVSKAPSRQQDGGSPDNWDSWSMGWLYPSQPIMMQLTVRMPLSMGYGEFYGRVVLTYRPWGDTIKGDTKKEDGIGRWLFYDCLSSGQWMLSGTDKDAPMVAIPSWSALLNYTVGTSGNTTTLGNCELTPSTDYYQKYGAGYKSPGWNGTTNPEGWPNTNGTGKAINFTLGARMSVNKWPGETAMTSWAHMESIGARAQMDWFTLGIDKNGNGNDNDAGEKFTFNFEPAADDTRPTIAYISQKDLRKGGVNAVIESRTSAVCKAGVYDTLFKIAGRIPDGGVGNLTGNPWFEVNDGSNLSAPTRAYTRIIQNVDNLWLDAGQFKQAWGFLEIPRWPYTVGNPTIELPYVLWTDESHVQ